MSCSSLPSFTRSVSFPASSCPRPSTPERPRLSSKHELFGLHQVVNNLTARPMPAPRFRTPLLYGFVRHPLYLGFIIAFWAAPTMTAGHLLFAVVTTAYIVVAIQFEERDLIELFGDEYRRYRDRVSMLVPWRRSA
jgi:methanethiol S-methyltransferase